MIRTSSGASTDLLRSRLARLGHVLRRGLVLHPAACGGSVASASDRHWRSRQVPIGVVSTGRRDRRRLTEDQRERGLGVPIRLRRPRRPASGRRRTCLRRPVGARSGSQNANGRQFTSVRAPSSLSPTMRARRARSVRARAKIPVGAHAEKAASDRRAEARRLSRPLHSAGSRDRTPVVVSPRRSTRPSTLPPPQGSARSSERSKVGRRLRRRISPSNEVVGDVCQEHGAHTSRNPRERPGRPLGRPGRSVS